MVAKATKMGRGVEESKSFVMLRRWFGLLSTGEVAMSERDEHGAGEEGAEVEQVDELARRLRAEERSRRMRTLVISLAVINSFKGFATVWVMTQGGPFYSSELLATYIYKLAFRFQDDGKAAALSMVLGLLAISSTLLYNKWRERVSR